MEDYNLYTPQQVEEIARQAALAAMERCSSPPNLDNISTRALDDPQKEEQIMPSKIRHKITLSNGQEFTLHGKTLGEAIENLLPKLNITSEAQTPVFSDYTSEWIELYHDPNSGDRWKRESRMMINKHLLPFFGKMHLGEISLNDVQRFFNSKADLSESSCKHLKYLLSGIFESAVEDGYMARDFTKSSRLTYSHKKTEREPLSYDDAQDVLTNLSKLSSDEQAMIALLMFTGIRRGELLALRWQDVDFEGGMIHVRHSVNFKDGNTPELKTPKSKAGLRDVPITDELKPFLHPLDPDTFVIGSKKTPLTARAYLCEFDRIRNKIDLHGATAHVLRHTFATISSERLDPKTLQRIMGHSKVDITMNRYAHSQDRLVEAAGDKLKGMYGTV